MANTILILEIFTYILVGMLGASFASFLNVAASGEKSFLKNITRKRSKCESCGKELSLFELIPIFSWIFLKGKCSSCRKKISPLHILSEIFLAAVFVVTFYYYNNAPYVFLLLSVVILILYFFSSHDIQHRSVPNRYIYLIIIITLILRFASIFWVNYPLLYVSDFIAGGIIYASLYVFINIITKAGFIPGVPKGKQGFGWGDAKFSFWVGILLGFERMLVAMWTGIFAGGFLGVILISKSKKKGQKIPYVPFISFGAWIAMIWGGDIACFFRNLLVI